ncbi:MAG: hypothetical protein M5U12_33590 [Verrucomicrobia bacterium]|nr:hypothetical protein [Gammaproteobacteria bacterium]MCZ7640561.1 hypothetical protein [Verrucomicrobiota bacterium]
MPPCLTDPGRDWGVERQTYTDPVTGLSVQELTRPGTAADNLYFHFSNFTADNRHVLFTSDRTGSTQLYRAEVATGRIVQLTADPEVSAATGEVRLLATGLRDTVRVHPHPSFDRQGHFVQFHSGRTHETVALIDLRQFR